MDDNTVFADAKDYAARYGPLGDDARVAVLLGDASDVLLSAYAGSFGTSYTEGAHPVFDRSAQAVCCSMVQRALNVPTGMAGATQYSQGGGGYTASVSFGSALGDLYLGKSDLKRLGLDGARMGVVRPMVRDV